MLTAHVEMQLGDFCQQRICIIGHLNVLFFTPACFQIHFKMYRYNT